jgi:hypothetical protein
MQHFRDGTKSSAGQSHRRRRIRSNGLIRLLPAGHQAIFETFTQFRHRAPVRKFDREDSLTRFAHDDQPVRRFVADSGQFKGEAVPQRDQFPCPAHRP